MRSVERMAVPHEQQTPLGHRELDEYIGVTIARQTHILLRLFHQGEIRFPKPARDYLEGATTDYLREAEKGSISLYNWRGTLFDDVDLSLEDAAHHVFVIFSFLPTFGAELESEINRILRRSIMDVPETREEFLRKIGELKMGIRQVAEEKLKPKSSLSQDPVLFKTFEFFRMASELPIKSRVDESAIKPMPEDRFNKLLSEVQF